MAEVASEGTLYERTHRGPRQGRAKRPGLRVHNGAMVPAVPSASSKRRARLAGLAALAAVLALPAAAEIFRCTSPGGAVSYQQAACPESNASRVVDVPLSYPNADPAQRQQLFAREAALDRRLEARRERESREAIARAEQAAAQAAAEAAAQQARAAGRLPAALVAAAVFPAALRAHSSRSAPARRAPQLGGCGLRRPSACVQYTAGTNMSLGTGPRR